MGKSSLTLPNLDERLRVLEKKLAHEPFDIDKQCPQCQGTDIASRPHHPGEQKQLISRGFVARAFKCNNADCRFEWSFITAVRSSC